MNNLPERIRSTRRLTIGAMICAIILTCADAAIPSAWALPTGVCAIVLAALVICQTNMLRRTGR